MNTKLYWEFSSFTIIKFSLFDQIYCSWIHFPWGWVFFLKFPHFPVKAHMLRPSCHFLRRAKRFQSTHGSRFLVNPFHQLANHFGLPLDSSWDILTPKIISCNTMPEVSLEGKYEYCQLYRQEGWGSNSSSHLPEGFLDSGFQCDSKYYYSSHQTIHRGFEAIFSDHQPTCLLMPVHSTNHSSSPCRLPCGKGRSGSGHKPVWPQH